MTAPDSGQTAPDSGQIAVVVKSPNLGEGGDADAGAAEGEGRAAVAREPEARVQRRHLPGRRRNKDEGLEFELERAVSLVRSALLGRMFKLLFIATAEPHPDSSNRESTPTAAWG